MFPAHTEDVASCVGPIPPGSSGHFHQGPIQLVATSGVMDFSRQQNSNISQQNYHPPPFIFPSVPPLSGRSVMDVTIRNGTSLIDQQQQQQQPFVRGSPVGANASGVMNVNDPSGTYFPQNSEASNQDGASSSRLSIYSVCI